MTDADRTDVPSQIDWIARFIGKRGLGACICEGQEINAVLDERDRLRAAVTVLAERVMKYRALMAMSVDHSAPKLTFTDPSGEIAWMDEALRLADEAMKERAA